MTKGTKLKVGPPDDTTAMRTQDRRMALVEDYARIRRHSLVLAAPLSPEDQAVQSMPDVSPTKWHLAHTTWFFETFLLKPFAKSYLEFHPGYDYLFNSYYYTVGQMHARPRRGLLSRPGAEDVRAYRAHVDAAMADLLADAPERDLDRIAFLTETGLNHEQQHQELMLTDIKHVMSCNPLHPAAYPAAPAEETVSAPLGWRDFEGGVRSVGHGGGGFAFDNETPRHEVLLNPFRLATRLVTNGEYLAFIEDGGYGRVDLWLSDGWAVIAGENWRAPLYWILRDGQWFEFTLAGLVPLDPNRPVAHVSYYEANAYAAWAGCRLPTEFELEAVADGASAGGNQLIIPLTDEEPLSAPEPRPAPCAREPHASDMPPLTQIYGDVWEWTMSAYAPYPRFRPLEGSLGEYNGKFMCNQLVLRGGSCATPRGHMRPTYRNFFPAGARWQFSGLRLAADA